MLDSATDPLPQKTSVPVEPLESNSGKTIDLITKTNSIDTKIQMQTLSASSSSSLPTNPAANIMEIRHSTGEDTRTRPTQRYGSQCWINASITALFACPWIRGHLRQILDSAVNTAHMHNDDGRLYRELKALAASPRDCRARDSLRESTQLRLALTYEQAMTDSQGGQGFVPWLMWNQF